MARFGVVVAAVAAVVSVAGAMQVDVPVSTLVVNSDRVVIVEVAEVGQATEMTLDTPGYDKPRTGWFKLYKVKVVEDLRADKKAQTQPADKEPEVLEVLSPAEQPRAGGGLRPMLADGPTYANLQQGQKYMLLLQKMPKRDELFLEAYFKRFRFAEDELVTRVRPMANLDKWAWGKAADGLQIAVMAEPATVMMRPGETKLLVPSTVALRNSGKAALRVPIYMPDRQLDVLALDKAGQAKSIDGIYPQRPRPNQPAFGPKHVLVIEPGQVVAIGPDGKSDYGTGLLTVQPDTAALQATFKAQREEEVADEKLPKLWKGEIKSDKSPVAKTAAEVGNPSDAPPPRRPTGVSMPAPELPMVPQSAPGRPGLLPID